jgi:phosphoheptose isomerase
MNRFLARLVEKYPDLAVCTADIERSADTLQAAFQQGGKLLICGNGGSAADCEHLVGELMKGYLLPRPLPPSVRQKLIERFPDNGNYLADHLQGALPAISLVSQTALLTAYGNDVSSEMAFAQQVYGYGRSGDVVLGISTSGNARNVVYALQVGRALGLHTIGCTGRSGGQLLAHCEVAIRVPWDGTADIQERHLAIYHALCGIVEEAFFADSL